MEGLVRLRLQVCIFSNFDFNETWFVLADFFRPYSQTIGESDIKVNQTSTKTMTDLSKP